MIKQPSAASTIESPVTVHSLQRDGEGAGIGRDAADAGAETHSVDHIVRGHANRLVDDKHTGNCIFKILVIHKVPPAP